MLIDYQTLQPLLKETRRKTRSKGTPKIAPGSFVERLVINMTSFTPFHSEKNEFSRLKIAQENFMNHFLLQL